MKAKLGESIPPGDEHALSVMFPTWQDLTGYMNRDVNILSRMHTGYPRFFIPRMVNRLATALLMHVANRTRKLKSSSSVISNSDPSRPLALLFPAYKYAVQCQNYLMEKATSEQSYIEVTCVDLTGIVSRSPSVYSTLLPWYDRIYLVTYPERMTSLAKSFWTFTGSGLSSRQAAYWLNNTPFILQESLSTSHEPEDTFSDNQAMLCKDIIRERVASLMSTDKLSVSSRDVFLYHSGMSAISNVTSVVQGLCMKRDQSCRVVIFGFLYADTSEVVSRVYGIEMLLYGHNSPSELDMLELELASGVKIDALYTEFPGNPLLRSPDLNRLYTLSKQYDFILLVDDTVGTAVNLSLLGSCDIVCSSSSKMFSGGCNVMGGHVALNPHSRHYQLLYREFNCQFLDTYFPLDAIRMEKNSQDFIERVNTATRNAEIVVDLLRDHQIVTEVNYPKDSASQHFYDQFKRPDAGYGFLLSITFISPRSAVAFYNALDVAKGPTLGTNFTLATGYALLAHFHELDRVAEFGIPEHLIRISVGLEDNERLIAKFKRALDAAQKAESRPTPPAILSKM